MPKNRAERGKAMIMLRPVERGKRANACNERLASSAAAFDRGQLLEFHSFDAARRTLVVRKITSQDLLFSDHR